MANTRLKRTVSNSSSSGRRTFTWSGWIKRNNVTAGYQNLFSAYGGANYYTRILYWDTQELTVSSKQGSNFPVDLRSTTKHRDTNAWYHIVVAMDSTQSTVTDRIKIYFNGVRQTGFHGGDSSYPSLNEQCQINHNDPHYIGHLGSGSSGYFDGIISHVHFADGTAYPASTFGSTDSTTGEWTINTSPSFTPGTNGFSILKDGNGVTDVSANSNNWSVESGTLTATKDCPDNVFATMNPLDNFYPNFNLANGNTSVGAGNGPRTYLLSTMGLAPTGKYYWEIKLQGQSNGASSNSVLFGISQKSTDSTSEDLTDGVASSTVIDGSGRVYVEGSLAGTFGSSYEPSTVMCLAYDAVNNKMYFGKDGTWLNSGNPTSGSTGTGAFTPTATNGAYNNIYMPCWGVNYNSGYSSAFNFGNGYFNTTAVSSAGTNASGNGIFEHNVPSGYTALSTKGLNL